MPTNIFDMSDSWNNVAVTFNGIKMNVSNVASAANSKLLDLAVNGISEFNVAPDGIATGETPPLGDNSKKLITSAWIVDNIGVGPFLTVTNPVGLGKFTIGTAGGNVAGLQGSPAGQQAVVLSAEAISSDTDVNIHVQPKGGGGVLLYSNGALQAAVSGPASANDYLILSGAASLQDPIVSSAAGGSIRIDDSILVGPAGGNFMGLFGSPGAGQAVSVRADNVGGDNDVNIHMIPKGIGGTLFYSSGALQAIINGPPNTTSAVDLSGAIAGSNPVIRAAFASNIDVENANLTGVPHAPTAAPGTNNTQVATTAFVAASGGAFVADSGDTMTGRLTISDVNDNSDTIILNSATSPGIKMRAASATQDAFLYQFNDTVSLSNTAQNIVTFNLVNRATNFGGDVSVATTLSVGGNIAMTKASPIIALSKTASGQGSTVLGQIGALLRWALDLGDNGAEGGANAGSNFTIRRFNDAGTLIDTPLAINRASGEVIIAGSAQPGFAFTPTTGSTTSSYMYQNQDQFIIASNDTSDTIRTNHATSDLSLIKGPLRVLNPPAGPGETNYERFAIDWLTNPNTATIGPQQGGTGVARKTWAIGLWTFTGNAPQTKTADFAVAQTDVYLICNKGSAMIATLPVASSHPGRELTFKNVQAFTVASASANIVPRNGGAAAAAILPATIGAWALLVSDGTNWVTMQAA